MIRAAAGLAIACLAAATTPVPAQEAHPHNGLRLPRVFGDGMVVQRDVPIPVWGWASPGAAISVVLASDSMRATSDALGHWSVSFRPRAGGTSLSLSVADGMTRLQVRDIVAGDVWLASGQSNMEWQLWQAHNGTEAIASANDAGIRHFGVPHAFAEQPLEDVSGGSWSTADREHVGSFTAVGYFFAQEVRKSVQVPIGILHTSWGGSNIETWLSRQALGLAPGEWERLLAADRARTDSLRTGLQARLGTLPTADGGMVNGVATWAADSIDDSLWSEIAVPALWESRGYDGLDGVAWYRTVITLSASQASSPARLSLGPIDDNEITWVNGTEVGRTNGYSVDRVYNVPALALRVGRNVVTVRVSDGGGGGGIYGAPGKIFLDAGGSRVSLAGKWRFRVGRVDMIPDGQRVNKIPTVLHNAMLHPLQRVPIQGVLWYQGESNANNNAQALAYRGLFESLVRSWRAEWSGSDRSFPFLWVQLPGFGSPDSVPPAQSAWATHRESMSAALALPNTGQAIAIDLGEANDIHPRNKLDVGIRLARVALRSVYQRQVVASGPVYRAHAIKDGRVTIEFDHTGGGLVTRRADGAVGGFAIAGADHKLVWADARIDGNRVIVWSDKVANPVTVRYAWSSNPNTASLYNRDGLPAAPFRTDK